MFKNSQIYIVLTPEFEGYFNGKSLPAYGRMGKVRIEKKKKNEKIEYIFLYFFQVFLIDEVGSDIFLKQVQEFETNNCL